MLYLEVDYGKKVDCTSNDSRMSINHIYFFLAVQQWLRAKIQQIQQTQKIQSLGLPEQQHLLKKQANGGEQNTGMYI